MSDKGKVIAGLIVLVVVAMVPIWYSFATEQEALPPRLELPRDATECVESKDFMTAHHMQLLDEWRDAVVRGEKKTYVSNEYGVAYEMSLTGTCLGCHRGRDSFCNRCHDYTDVHPYCWDCHIEPKGK